MTLTRINLLNILTADRQLPTDTTHWGIRAVHPDLRSRHNYLWPYPGNWAEAPGPINPRNDDPCPSDIGDGICAAITWAGIASGGITAQTLLLIAFHESDALSPIMSADKVRLQRAYVVDIIDGGRLIREHGSNADLRYANLTRANLTRANLMRADLTRADLMRADLTRANLRYADLTGADLAGANLAGANLTGANLWRANLAYANLAYADLAGANLAGANLTGVDLAGANLTGVDLTGANPWRANLAGANLAYAINVNRA